MKRAEWFVTRGLGHWAKARKPFLCDFKGRFGPCLNPVAAGEVYLATDLAKYPRAANNKYALVCLRYCFHCADGELPGQAVATTAASAVR